jgi:hypothetical protein
MGVGHYCHEHRVGVTADVHNRFRLIVLPFCMLQRYQATDSSVDYKTKFTSQLRLISPCPTRSFLLYRKVARSLALPGLPRLIKLPASTSHSQKRHHFLSTTTHRI